MISCRGKPRINKCLKALRCFSQRLSVSAGEKDLEKDVAQRRRGAENDREEALGS